MVQKIPADGASPDLWEMARAGWEAAAPTDTFLETWGSGFLTGRFPGTAWNTVAPGLPNPIDGWIFSIALTPEARGQTLDAAPAAAKAYQVTVETDLIMLVPSDNTWGRFTLDSGRDELLRNLGDGIVYCARPEGCICPESGEALVADPISSPFYLGLTGGLESTSVRIIGASLDEVCDTSDDTDDTDAADDSPEQAAACLVGDWRLSQATVVGSDGMQAAGGSGVRMHIGPYGEMNTVFDGMANVLYAFPMDEDTICGSFFYTGEMTGLLRTDPEDTVSGNWAPSTVDVSGVTAWVTILAPFQVDLGAVPLGFASSVENTGGAVGGTPMDAGAWSCTANSLTLSRTETSGTASTTTTWEMARE